MPGGDLMFRSKTSSADYHEEINYENFMEWFMKQLLPSIPDNAVIVWTMLYTTANKMTMIANKKQDFRNWLDEPNIQ